MAAGATETFGLKGDTLRFQGLDREPLGGLPPVLDQPVGAYWQATPERGQSSPSTFLVASADLSNVLCSDSCWTKDVVLRYGWGAEKLARQEIPAVAA